MMEKLHIEEFSEIILFTNTIRVIKSSKIWVGHVTRIGGVRNAYVSRKN
jgi:hypothetical protein